MGKILDFKDFKKKRAVAKGNLDNVQLEKIEEMLELQRSIAEELFQMTELILAPSDLIKAVNATVAQIAR